MLTKQVRTQGTLFTKQDKPCLASIGLRNIHNPLKSFLRIVKGYIDLVVPYAHI